jgi:hypothetical protein
MPPMPTNPWPLGKCAVTTAGTPLDLLTASGNAAKLSSATGLALRVKQIIFFLPTAVNTGNVYIGTKGLTKATFVNVIFAMAPQVSPAFSTFVLDAAGWGGGNELIPEQIFVDGDTNGNYILATLVQY